MNKKHLLIMLVCCLLPITVLASIYVFKIPIRTVLWIALLLACPLSHLFMMKAMSHKHGEVNPSLHPHHHE